METVRLTMVQGLNEQTSGIGGIGLVFTEHLIIDGPFRLLSIHHDRRQPSAYVASIEFVRSLSRWIVEEFSIESAVI